MNLTAYGVDTAKNVFQVYTVEPTTGEIVNKQIKRAKFLVFFTLHLLSEVAEHGCAPRLIN